MFLGVIAKQRHKNSTFKLKIPSPPEGKREKKRKLKEIIFPKDRKKIAALLLKLAIELV